VSELNKNLVFHLNKLLKKNLEDVLKGLLQVRLEMEKLGNDEESAIEKVALASIERFLLEDFHSLSLYERKIVAEDNEEGLKGLLLLEGCAT